MYNLGQAAPIGVLGRQEPLMRQWRKPARNSGDGALVKPGKRNRSVQKITIRNSQVAFGNGR